MIDSGLKVSRSSYNAIGSQCGGTLLKVRIRNILTFTMAVQSED